MMMMMMTIDDNISNRFDSIRFIHKNQNRKTNKKSNKNKPPLLLGYLFIQYNTILLLYDDGIEDDFDEYEYEYVIQQHYDCITW